MVSRKKIVSIKTTSFQTAISANNAAEKSNDDTSEKLFDGSSASSSILQPISMTMVVDEATVIAAVYLSFLLSF